MNVHEDLVKPTHCFCQIPEEELKYWFHKRYNEHHSTIDLLSNTDDPHEKEVISIVALLDLDDKIVTEMMSNVPPHENQVLHCRKVAKEMLHLSEEDEE